MSYPAMQLYIMAGANANVQGDQLLYVGLACAELVEFLELRGISVEVNVMIGTSFSNQVAMACVRVKRFQDKLDKNQLLLISSDPRYFRFDHSIWSRQYYCTNGSRFRESDQLKRLRF